MKIKQLEWYKLEYEDCYVAESPLHIFSNTVFYAITKGFEDNYTVIKYGINQSNDNDHITWLQVLWYTSSIPKQEFKEEWRSREVTLENAKQIAQEHFESLIKNCLEE